MSNLDNQGRLESATATSAIIPESRAGTFRLRLADFRLPFFLVLADAATKIASYAMLPLEQRSVGISDGLYLYLHINETGIGANQEQFYQDQPSFGIAMAVATLAESAIIVALSRANIRLVYKILIGIGSWLALALGAFVCATHIPINPQEAYTSHLVYRCANLVLAIVLLSASKSKFFRVCFGFFVAGAAGNLLSYLYPPFAIVDFIYLWWLRNLFRGAVYNLADLYLLTCGSMLMAAPAYFLIHHLVARQKRRAVPVARNPNTDRVGAEHPPYMPE